LFHTSQADPARDLAGRVRYDRGMECSACARLAKIVDGSNPDFVATLSESHVTLADEQAYRGYCILLLKDHHEQLDALPFDRQRRLWDDVTRVAAALRKIVSPVRLNYACLGNFVTHVHWHVIPRHADDPEPLNPIWNRPLSERRKSLPVAEREALVRELRTALGR
jgi:diadenosine tetraphosphate (Ap4A) HIT family hydrolase